MKHQYKVRIFMDESVSFGTLGVTGHGVTEHLNVPVCELQLYNVRVLVCMYSGCLRVSHLFEGWSEHLILEGRQGNIS